MEKSVAEAARGRGAGVCSMHCVSAVAEETVTGLWEVPLERSLV